MGKHSTRSSQQPSRRRIRTPTTDEYGGGSGREREREKDSSLRKKAKLLIHELGAFYSHDRFSFLSLQTNHGSLEVSALAAMTQAEGREWRRRSRRRAAKLPDPADEANEAEISPRSMLWMRICQNLSRRRQRRRRRRHGKEGRQLGTEIDAHKDIYRVAQNLGK